MSDAPGPLRSRMLEVFGRDATFARVLSGSGWLIGGTVVATAAGFVQSILVARRLGAGGFGLLGLVLVVVMVGRQLLSSRVWEAATKYVVQYREAGDPTRATAALKLCYLVDACTGAVAFAVILATAPLVGEAFTKSPEGASLIRLYAFSVLILIPRDPALALLRVAGAYRWLAFEMAGESILTLGGVLLIVLANGDGARAVLTVYLGAQAAGSLALVVLTRPAERSLGLASWGSAPLRALRGELRPILRFMVYTNVSGTTRLVTGYADILFLGAIATKHSVGLYRLALTLSYPIAALAQPVYQVVYPELTRLVALRDRKAILSLQRKLSGAGAAVVVCTCVATTVAAGWVIPRVFGPQFSESTPLLRIMVWQLVSVPFLWVSGFLLALGHPRRVALLASVDALVYLALLGALVPPFHATGAAVATLLRFVVWTALAIAFSRRANREMGEAWKDGADERAGDKLTTTPR